MSSRKEIIVTGEMYHVFNRSIDKQKIFKNSHDYRRLLEVIQYYRFINVPIRYSHFNRLKRDQKKTIWEQLKNQANCMIEIHAFCIMPNHFHFLIRPLVENGLSDYMRLIQLGYAKYFNKKYRRTGVLFESAFKVVRIEDDDQFIHVHRYILLNPVTAYLIKMDELSSYYWSSYQYMSDSSFVTNDLIMSYFSTNEAYLQFLRDQEDYQKQLHIIKHLLSSNECV